MVKRCVLEKYFFDLTFTDFQTSRSKVPKSNFHSQKEGFCTLFFRPRTKKQGTKSVFKTFKFERDYIFRVSNYLDISN